MKSKIIALILVLTLVFTMSLPAFAADAAPKVMIDGRYISFGANAPYQLNGRVMAPYSTFLDAIGAGSSIDINTGRVTAVYNNVSVEFYAGVAGFALYSAGQKYEFPMDVAPQIKGDTVYIPVRFASQAFGLSVSWDAQTNTAVLVDFAKIKDSINKKFSIINALSALSVNPAKTYKYDGTLSADIVVATEGEPAIPVKLNGTFTEMSRGDNATAGFSFTTNIAELAELAKAQYAAMQEEPDADTLKSMESAIALLSQVGMDIIVNSDDQIYYVKSPILDYFIKESTGKETAAGTWYKYDVNATLKASGIDPAALADMSAAALASSYIPYMNMIPANGAFDIGSTIAMVFAASGAEFGVSDYQILTEIIGLVESLIGDKAFVSVKNDDGSITFKYMLDNKALAAGLVTGLLSSPALMQLMMADMSQYSDVNSPDAAVGIIGGADGPTALIGSMPEFAVALEITVKDKYTYSVKGEISLNEINPDDEDTYTKLNMKFSSSVPGASSFEMTLNNNSYGDKVDVTVKMDYTMVEDLFAKPAKAPASDAVVVDLFELMNTSAAAE